MAPVNLATWLVAGADDAVALSAGDERYTFAQLRARSERVAAFVTERLGDGVRGAVVPIVAAPSFAMVAAHFGILWAGAVSAPLPPLDDVQLARVLTETRARLLFASAPVAPYPDVEVVDVQVPMTAVLSPAQVDPHAVAMLLYTSGSTGRPRGVMLSAANIVANTNAILALRPLASSDVGVLMMPLHYCYGLSVLHSHLRAGACTVLGSAQYPGRIVPELQRVAATGLIGVPTLFQTLLDRTDVAKAELPALRYVMSSGGKLKRAVVERLREALPSVQVYLRYGVTELTSAVACLDPADVIDHADSIGRGLAGVALSVQRPDGSEVERDGMETGEIVVAGESVSLGYFEDPTETARCFRAGAFFTGDLATVDGSGRVSITGRGRDFIKTAGHRVAPQEIEEAVARLEGVGEVIAFGLADPQLGEAIVVGIEPAPGVALSVEAVRRHCRACLPPHKRPTQIRIMERLPRTQSGKPNRPALRAEW